MAETHFVAIQAYEDGCQKATWRNFHENGHQHVCVCGQYLGVDHAVVGSTFQETARANVIACTHVSAAHTLKALCFDCHAAALAAAAREAIIETLKWSETWVPSYFSNSVFRERIAFRLAALRREKP